MNNKQLPQTNEVKYLGIHLDRRLTWRQHITMKRKQLDHKLRTLYWLIGRKSQLSLSNKLPVYTLTIKPTWTYGIQLWGSASNSHLDILERFQSKALRMLTNAPWFVPNAIIRNDLSVTTIRQEVTTTGRGSMCIPTTWQPPYSKGYPATEDSNGIILKTWSLDLITSM